MGAVLLKKKSISEAPEPDEDDVIDETKCLKAGYSSRCKNTLAPPGYYAAMLGPHYKDMDFTHESPRNAAAGRRKSSADDSSAATDANCVDGNPSEA